jgi:hypothetical protein
VVEYAEGLWLLGFAEIGAVETHYLRALLIMANLSVTSNFDGCVTFLRLCCTGFQRFCKKGREDHRTFGKLLHIRGCSGCYGANNRRKHITIKNLSDEDSSFGII